MMYVVYTVMKLPQANPYLWTNTRDWTNINLDVVYVASFTETSLMEYFDILGFIYFASI